MTTEVGDGARETLPPVEKWLVQDMRATFFLPPKTEVDASRWWEDALGAVPEEQTAKRKLGVEIYQGPFEQWRACLSLQPGRIDWRLGPLGGEALGVAALGVDLAGVLGPFPSAVTVIRKIVGNWAVLPDCPSATRLAFGSTLVQPVADRSTGYGRLAEYIEHSVNVDVPIMRDVTWRVNRRREIPLLGHDILINRLNTWAVLYYRAEATMRMPERDPASVLSAEAFAVRLELDINTAPEYTNEIPPGGFGEVLGALCMLGEEIAAKGDIP